MLLDYASSNTERPNFGRTIIVFSLVILAILALSGICISNSATIGLPCFIVLFADGGAIFVTLLKWRKQVHIVAAITGWVIFGIAAVFFGIFVFGLIGIVLNVFHP